MFFSVKMSATARRGLRSACLSPGSNNLVVNSNNKLSSPNGSRSPKRNNKLRSKANSPNQSNSADEDFHHSNDEWDANSEGNDEIDCAIPKQNHYPDLKKIINENIEGEHSQLEESISSLDLSSRSHNSYSNKVKHRTYSHSPQMNDILSKSSNESTHKVLEGYQPKGKVGFMPIFYIGLIFFLILGLFFFSHQVQKIKNEKMVVRKKNITEIYKDLKEDLQILHKQLVLTRHTWVQVRSQLDSIMVSSPQQPAVILVIVPVGAERTASCFTHRVSESIKVAFEGILLTINI